MVFNHGSSGNTRRHDLAPVCKWTGEEAATPEPTSAPMPQPMPLPTPPQPTPPQPVPLPTPSPPTDGTPKYQRFPYHWPRCPEGFDITSEEECSEAIASLGVALGDTPWTGSAAGMPRFCSLQKDTDSMVFNHGSSGNTRRHDLAPVCKWTGEEAATPEPTSAPMPQPMPLPTPPQPTPPQPVPLPTSSPPTDGTPKYQRFPYHWPHCPEPFDITSEEECNEAIASLGVTNGDTPWTGS